MYTGGRGSSMCGREQTEHPNLPGQEKNNGVCETELGMVGGGGKR